MSEPRPARDVIAGVLELHSRRTDPNHPGWLDCRCGFGCGDDSRAYRAHVTDALIAAGVTVVKPCTRWIGCTLHDKHDGRCFV